MNMEGVKGEKDLLLQHFCHEHALVFVQDHSPSNKGEEAEEDEEAQEAGEEEEEEDDDEEEEDDDEEEEEEARCSCCWKRVEGPSYCCRDCKFYLHKKCAELELAPEINHPFHPKHPLTLLPKSPYQIPYVCSFCGRHGFSGFVYHCDYCQFNLDINCALLKTSPAENFPICLHNHPMVFIENHKKDVVFDCEGCKKSLSGPIYRCSECLQFYLHKKCVELPLQINHPYDRIHPLSLMARNPYTAHHDKCSCSLCEIKWDGFVYSCSICNIELTPEDVSAPPRITAAGDGIGNPWTLVSCQISFTCDFCGAGGDRTPYICSAGDLILHRHCISLPRAIRIARHPHPISHVYSVQNYQLEELECRICFENVNARYGCYICRASNCNYIAHVKCATDKEVWDGTVVLEDDVISEVNEPMNMITDVISEVSVGEDVMATEIKHAFHHHNLILTLMGEIKDGNICDGCMLPISSTPFYNCQECRFFLHKTCAELPREKGHAIHKHLLKLTKNDDFSLCQACYKIRHGFSYKCDKRKCLGFQIDVQCSLLPDNLKHPGHDEHSLFLIHNFTGDCSGCHDYSWKRPAYRCKKRCDFVLDFSCLVLPLTAEYKYDRHPLTLTYLDNSDPNQRYCDFCEEERDSRHWFYYCAHCDNSIHQECVRGQLPFIKDGRLCRDHLHLHEHPLTFVDNIWNCPLCIACGKVCYRQALECKESECNFIVHWECTYLLQS